MSRRRRLCPVGGRVGPGCAPGGPEDAGGDAGFSHGQDDRGTATDRSRVEPLAAQQPIAAPPGHESQLDGSDNFFRSGVIPRNINDVIDDLIFTLKPAGIDVLSLRVSQVFMWHQRGVRAFNRRQPKG